MLGLGLFFVDFSRASIYHANGCACWLCLRWWRPNIEVVDNVGNIGDFLLAGTALCGFLRLLLSYVGCFITSPIRRHVSTVVSWCPSPRRLVLQMGWLVPTTLHLCLIAYFTNRLCVNHELRLRWLFLNVIRIVVCRHLLPLRPRRRPLTLLLLILDKLKAVSELSVRGITTILQGKRCLSLCRLHEERVY